MIAARTIHVAKIPIQNEKSFQKNTQEVNFAGSDGPEKLRTVVVTGAGTDSNSATKNAIRATVEHTATYIRSESRLSDFELEKDLMEAYSNATVR